MVIALFDLCEFLRIPGHDMGIIYLSQKIQEILGHLQGELLDKVKKLKKVMKLWRIFTRSFLEKPLEGFIYAKVTHEDTIRIVTQAQKSFRH